MKIFMLSDPNSSHTIKWATSLANYGVDIVIFGIGKLDVDCYESYTNIKVVVFSDISNKYNSDFHKLKYLMALPIVKRVIREVKPQIVHAHYATSYALLGALSGFHPFIVSVWGSDVFDFPRISRLHRLMLKYNLQRADKVLSTSHVMAKETKKYTNNKIVVTPFGIDTNVFTPGNHTVSVFQGTDIVIGTVKALEENYGIEYLMRAFNILKHKYPQLPLKMLIVGGGSLDDYLKKLALDLGLNNSIVFTGKVSYADVPKYHNILSVSVFVSNCESFGVAVIEASACAKPVIVSNVGGLPEVVEDGVTGIIVPPRDVFATADAIERLVLDNDLRIKMGKAGRERVKKFFNWDDNVGQMLNIYRDVISD